MLLLLQLNKTTEYRCYALGSETEQTGVEKLIDGCFFSNERQQINF